MQNSAYSSPGASRSRFLPDIGSAWSLDKQPKPPLAVQQMGPRASVKLLTTLMKLHLAVFLPQDLV